MKRLLPLLLLGLVACGKSSSPSSSSTLPTPKDTEEVVVVRVEGMS